MPVHSKIDRGQEWGVQEVLGPMPWEGWPGEAENGKAKKRDDEVGHALKGEGDRNCSETVVGHKMVLPGRICLID